MCLLRTWTWVHRYRHKNRNTECTIDKSVNIMGCSEKVCFQLFRNSAGSATARRSSVSVFHADGPAYENSYDYLPSYVQPDEHHSSDALLEGKGGGETVWGSSKIRPDLPHLIHKQLRLKSRRRRLNDNDNDNFINKRIRRA